MIVKVFINNENKATFICPNCKKSKIVDVSQYTHSVKAVNVNCKCPCGHNYKALLERRKHYRKEVNLSGRYIWGNKGGRIMIQDISKSGVKFRVNFKPDFKIDDRIWIEFNIDNEAKSFIRKEVVIHTIRDLIIGVEFCNQDHYDLLGPYLLA